MPGRAGSLSARLAEIQSLRPSPGVHSTPGSMSAERLRMGLRAAPGAAGIQSVSLEAEFKTAAPLGLAPTDQERSRNERGIRTAGSPRLALRAVFSRGFMHLVREAVCLMYFWWEKLKAPGTVTQLMMEHSDILK